MKNLSNGKEEEKIDDKKKRVLWKERIDKK